MCYKNILTLDVLSLPKKIAKNVLFKCLRSENYQGDMKIMRSLLKTFPVKNGSQVCQRQ